MRQHVALAALLAVAACGDDGASSGTYALSTLSGMGQTETVGSTLQPFQVRVLDANGAPAENVTVSWKSLDGCGELSSSTSRSDDLGIATVTATLGILSGIQVFEASVAHGNKVLFQIGATPPPSPTFRVIAGCNTVPERYSSDLWVADGYAYTGTWGFREKVGNAIKVWQIADNGYPTFKETVTIPDVGTISDLEVSADGKWLIATTEGGDKDGLYVYEVTSPGTLVKRASNTVGAGLHTGTLATIGGKLYAFTAKDPANCALNIYDLSDAAAGNITTASSTPIPDHYCIHDTFVRDGLAFVFAWDEGLYIFDVGQGSLGGSPTDPKLISQSGQKSAAGSFGGSTHNGWWFWNPTNGEKRYLFVGQELPGILGVSSGGSIHVVDVSNLTAPVEVAHYTLPGAGVHNFWMDEPGQVLYAAFYNGGVVALDVSGTLTGDLASREIARIKPGGPNNTYMWGVMLYRGYLYGSDMVSGFWQLAVP